jgi:hypothetical protein
MNLICKITIGLSLLSNTILFAQDSLVLKNNSKLLIKIIESGANETKYSSFRDQSGPVFSINNSEVAYIVYADGYKQIIEPVDSTINYNSTKYLYINGQADADHFYKGYRGASTGTLIISLISPIIGLIPAIGCSSTVPSDDNLQYPSTELFHKTDYQRGYKIQAKRIKSKKVWTNWGIALGVNIAVVLISQQ